MATTNDNSTDLAKYRGEVTLCPYCSTTQMKRAGVEMALAAKACTRCLGHGFIARCLNCTDGLETNGSVWDGGKTSHRSVCNICGGQGFFAARRPADWVDEPVAPTVLVEQGAKPMNTQALPRPH